jgi:hypothetical protein
LNRAALQRYEKISKLKFFAEWLPAASSSSIALRGEGKFVNVYQIRPRKNRRDVDLISDVLPLGRLWYGEPNAASNAIG